MSRKCCQTHGHTQTHMHTCTHVAHTFIGIISHCIAGSRLLDYSITHAKCNFNKFCHAFRPQPKSQLLSAPVCLPPLSLHLPHFSACYICNCYRDTHTHTLGPTHTCGLLGLRLLPAACITHTPRMTVALHCAANWRWRRRRRRRQLLSASTSTFLCILLLLVLLLLLFLLLLLPHLLAHNGLINKLALPMTGAPLRTSTPSSACTAISI